MFDHHVDIAPQPGSRRALAAILSRQIKLQRIPICGAKNQAQQIDLPTLALRMLVSGTAARRPHVACHAQALSRARWSAEATPEAP